MIFVTVGTHSQGFERLIRAADELAEQSDELVMIQYGSSSYVPKHGEAFPFSTSQHLEELIHAARVVITHAGVGSIIQGLKMCKSMVVVPRLKAYKEVFDDHQLQLSKALEDQGRVVTVYEPTLLTLLRAIDRVGSLYTDFTHSSPLVDALIDKFSAWKMDNP